MELELLEQGMKNPQPKPLISPATHVPVLEIDLWDGDDYWGIPLGTECVDLDETINFLEGNRDQSLWFSVMVGLNYDSHLTFEVVRWILEQPDCDAINAVVAFGAMAGPTLCGTPASGDPALGGDQLATLKIIEERERANRPYTVQFGPCSQQLKAHGDPSLGDGRGLLLNAREAAARLKAGEMPMLQIPEQTLRSGGTGAFDIVMCHVDECGIYVVPKGSKRVHG
jgi:hypothetical protein